ncbi:helix-turn-helix domain-containing protein [Edwardsiella piscicida]|uniref:helix-turn-helix domain-containing protein n=1 Tax=Edwardsiella piscicida TaxID=1263550 RepID=UPI000D50AC27|nr:helix-turn-helix domain-containing protein [Edwardsiella piscicida]UCQ22544.1 helix-turn-helix domain-containing protein [Edwardsiella piscicida]
MSMMLMAIAMKIKTGNPLRKLVLLKLADNANDQGECWPSIPYLAATCEMAERSVQNHIKWLHEHGFLWVERRKSKNGGHQSNIYHLTLERRLRSPLEEDENDEPSPAENQGKKGAAQGAGSTGANGASLSDVPVQHIRQGLSFDSLGVAQPLHPEPIIKNLSLEPIPPLPPNNRDCVEPDRGKTDREKPDGAEPEREHRYRENPERENLKRRPAEPMDYGAYLAAYNALVGDRLPHAVTVNEERKRKLRSLVKSLATPNLEGFRAYISAFLDHAKPFYFGFGDAGWIADFDYLLRQKTLTRVREGTL